MYWGGLIDIIAYARAVILLRLCLLERCLDPVFRTSIKTCNFVTFYIFLIHVGMHHTSHDAGRCGGHNMGGRDAAWPASAPAPSSRSHIPNPGRRRQEFLADVTCKDFQQVGHHAVNCDMLAMVLCLERYMRGHLSDAARDTIESEWVNQWK